MTLMTIGKVAKLIGIGVETIRFYERRGLIEKPLRSQSGYRHYSNDALRQLQFIRQAKKIGFTLKEIKELMSLRVDSHSDFTREKVRKLAEEKIAVIHEKIKVLKKMEVILMQLVGDCQRCVTSNGCPIIEALKQEEE